MSSLERSVEVLQKTDFSIERLLRKDPPPAIITINIEEDGQRVGCDTLTLNPHTAESEHQSQLQFHSDDPESQMTNTAEEEGEKDEESRYLLPHKNMGSTFSWLTCTRFKPPKLPRSKKRAGCKRYGRGPRIPFAPHQIAVLESTFSKSQYLSSDCIHRLADTLHLSETRVKIWFQNRRARYRREKEVPGLIHHQMSRHPGNLNIEHFQTLSPVMSPSQSPKSPGSHPRDGEIGQTNYNQKYLQSEDPYVDDLNGSPGKRKLLIPDLISFQLQQHRQAQQLQHYFYQQQRLSNSLHSSSSSTRSSRLTPIPNSQQTSSILHSALQSSPPQAHSCNNPAQFVSFSSPMTGMNPYSSSRVDEVHNSVPVSGMSSSQISRLISLNSAFASMPLGLSFQ